MVPPCYSTRGRSSTGKTSEPPKKPSPNGRTPPAWSPAAPTRGEVVVVADPGIPIVQNLIRWDMVSAARRELDERRDVEFPPTVHMAAIDGTVTALHHFIDQLDLPETAEILGPVDLPPGEKLPGSTAMKDYNEPVQRILVRATGPEPIRYGTQSRIHCGADPA